MESGQVHPQTLNSFRFAISIRGLTCRAMMLIERQAGDSCFMGLAFKQDNEMKRKRNVQMKIVQLS